MDQVAIANIALSHLQQKPINYLEGETWETARTDDIAHRAVIEHYHPVRREALSAHPWGFATVKEPLARSSYNPPEIRWVLSYVYPRECLRFIGMTDISATGGGYGTYPRDGTITLEGLARPGAGALVSPTGAGLNNIAADAFGEWMRWEVRSYREGDVLHKVVLSNLPGAVGEFVVDVDDPSIWSPRFATALSYLLAARIAPAVAKYNEGTQAYAIWMKILDEAKVADANESNPRMEQPASWIRARRGLR